MNSAMRPFSEIAPELSSDGSLRDFYIQNISRSDWNKFLKFISSLDHSFQVKWGEQGIDLPTSFEAIREMQNENGVLLQLTIAGGILCCHFFSDQEIELDFLPGDFDSEEKWNLLVGFLQRIVETIGRRGIVTHENSPEWIIQEIS